MNPPSEGSCKDALPETSQRSQVSIIAFPRDGDIYTTCFYDACAQLGADIREGTLSGRWLMRNLRNADYVHFHWPSFCYNQRPVSRCLRLFCLYVFSLGLARWRDIRILWTVHNLYPHESCPLPFLDILSRWILVRVTHRFLVHGASAEADFLRAFPAGAGRTILIGIGPYPIPRSDTMDRKAARAHFGLDESAYVFLFFGGCRPYKNLEGLIQAFQALPGDPVLIIAGQFLNDDYERSIRLLVERSRARIIFRPGFVPDEDVQLYLQAPDVMVTPYLKGLSSATAVLAMSFGLPVIAPSMGNLRDLVVDGCGILYDAARPDALTDAMLAAPGMRFDKAKILAQIATQDWGVFAGTVLDDLQPPAARTA